MKFRQTALALLAGALLNYAVPAGTAFATDIFTPLSGCKKALCDATTFGGTVNGMHTNNFAAAPWSAGMFALEKECVRLQITSTSGKFEMVVTAPDGTVWRNKKNGGVAACKHCPLLRIKAPTGGWYTVQVSTPNGADVERDFIMGYARYPKNNPNCSHFDKPL